MKLEVIILAAGHGKRMKSATPKVLHRLAGVTLLERVVNTAQRLQPAAIHVIYGHGGEVVQKALSDLPVNWVEQKEQLGTGHAVQQAMPNINPESRVLVLFGDVPLITLETLNLLLQQCPDNQLGLLVAKVADPNGLGRIIRDDKANVQAIVEHRDANEQQLQINEIFTGILTAPAGQLAAWVERLQNQNDQKEYYLTDVVSMAIADDIPVVASEALLQQEIRGVNDRLQLAQLEQYLRLKYAQELMLQAGVTIADPLRFDCRGQVTIKPDVYIDINVVLEGKVSIGSNCYIGPNVVIRNMDIGDNVVIKANSVLEDSTIGNNCIVGPFARIRPGTELQDEVHVGNFVEVKKSKVDQGSKINHLSYVGDAVVGKAVNIGAGTITCNYDGVNKFQTTIEDNCFIGSGTQLVAPVTINKGATIGAGSTITKDAKAEKLTLTRAKQATIEGWQRPTEQE